MNKTSSQNCLFCNSCPAGRSRDRRRWNILQLEVQRHWEWRQDTNGLWDGEWYTMWNEAENEWHRDSRTGTQTVQKKTWEPEKGRSTWLKSGRADSNWQKVKEIHRGKSLVMHRWRWRRFNKNLKLRELRLIVRIWKVKCWYRQPFSAVKPVSGEIHSLTIKINAYCECLKHYKLVFRILQSPILHVVWILKEIIWRGLCPMKLQQLTGK